MQLIIYVIEHNYLNGGLIKEGSLGDCIHIAMTPPLLI